MDKTGVEQFRRNLDNLLGPDDKDTRFWSWVAEASATEGGLTQAVAELGLDVPEGPRFGARLKDAYLAKVST